MANSGTNLTVWKNAQFFFDATSDVPVLQSTTQYLYISTAGTGFNIGYYSLGSINLNYDLTAQGQGIHNVFQTTAINADGSVIAGSPSALTSNSIAVPPQTGASWGYGLTPAAAYANAPATGFVGPTTTPNTAFTGFLAGVMVGDSRTQYNGNSLLTQLKADFPNASPAIVLYNAGQPGDTLEMYSKGNASGRYTAIVNYIKGFNANFIQIALGTNDKKSTVAPLPAVFQALYQTLVDNLYADCPTLRAVVAQEIPYTVITGSNAPFDANSDALGQAYNAALGNLTRVTVGRGEYAATAAHPELTGSDGVHPTLTAAPNGQSAATGLGYAAQTAFWSAALQPVLSALPASQPAPLALPSAPALPTGTVPQVLTWASLPARATAFRLYKDGNTIPIYDGPLTTYTDAVAPASAHQYTLSVYNASGETLKTALTAVGTVLRARGSRPTFRGGH